MYWKDTCRGKKIFSLEYMYINFYIITQDYMYHLQKYALTLFLGRGFVVTLMYSHTSCTPRDTAKLVYVLDHQYPGKIFNMSHPKQKSQTTIIL